MSNNVLKIYLFLSTIAFVKPSTLTFEKCTPAKVKINLPKDAETLSETQPCHIAKDLQLFQTLKCKDVLRGTKFSKTTFASNNGFVHSVVEAYSHHHHLVLRPDDVWIAIITQFSFYVTANPEAFRETFIGSEDSGKKELTVQIAPDTPFEDVVKAMGAEIEKNLKDPTVRAWVIPDFSTTTDNDKITAGIILMATLKEFFDYAADVECGFPSITLLGNLNDWKNLRERIKFLKTFELPALNAWVDEMGPVLEHFIAAKNGTKDEEFWNKAALTYDQCGGPYLNGWITVFCMFDHKGKPLGEKNGTDQWRTIKQKKIPGAVVEVDLTMKSNGSAQYVVKLIAGSMAQEIGADQMTLQPKCGWFVASTKAMKIRYDKNPLYIKGDAICKEALTILQGKRSQVLPKFPLEIDTGVEQNEFSVVYPKIQDKFSAEQLEVLSATEIAKLITEFAENSPELMADEDLVAMWCEPYVSEEGLIFKFFFSNLEDEAFQLANEILVENKLVKHESGKSVAKKIATLVANGKDYTRPQHFLMIEGNFRAAKKNALKQTIEEALSNDERDKILSKEVYGISAEVVMGSVVVLLAQFCEPGMTYLNDDRNKNNYLIADETTWKAAFSRATNPDLGNVPKEIINADIESPVYLKNGPFVGDSKITAFLAAGKECRNMMSDKKLERVNIRYEYNRHKRTWSASFEVSLYYARALHTMKTRFHLSLLSHSDKLSELAQRVAIAKGQSPELDLSQYHSYYDGEIAATTRETAVIQYFYKILSDHKNELVNAVEIGFGIIRVNEGTPAKWAVSILISSTHDQAQRSHRFPFAGFMGKVFGKSVPSPK